MAPAFFLMVQGIYTNTSKVYISTTANFYFSLRLYFNQDANNLKTIGQILEPFGIQRNVRYFPVAMHP